MHLAPRDFTFIGQVAVLTTSFALLLLAIILMIGHITLTRYIDKASSKKVLQNFRKRAVVRFIKLTSASLIVGSVGYVIGLLLTSPPRFSLRLLIVIGTLAYPITAFVEAGGRLLHGKHY